MLGNSAKRPRYHFGQYQTRDKKAVQDCGLRAMVTGHRRRAFWPRDRIAHAVTNNITYFTPFTVGAAALARRRRGYA